MYTQGYSRRSDGDWSHKYSVAFDRSIEIEEYSAAILTMRGPVPAKKFVFERVSAAAPESSAEWKLVSYRQSIEQQDLSWESDVPLVRP